MRHPGPGHDRETGVDDRDAGSVATRPAPRDDLLGAALERVRLAGALFLRAEYTESWSYESPPARDVAGMLLPGRDRVILFHVIAAGTCWIRLQDGERHWAQAGDVVVIPYGDQHRMGGSADAECVPMASLLTPGPWESLPVIRHGCGGSRTDVVCGYLDSDDPLFDPGMAALPRIFVVRPTGSAAGWVRASIDYALDLSGSRDAAGDAFRTRLPELLLVEVLRLHLTTAPSGTRGWLAALHDPVLAPALAAVHRAPEAKWTVTEMAAASRVSRSLLDERFRRVLGSSPMQYVTAWRMHVATDLLAGTDLGVRAVARRVGYESEEAFSRAFKRTLGRSPAHWRLDRTLAS